MAELVNEEELLLPSPQYAVLPLSPQLNFSFPVSFIENWRKHSQHLELFKLNEYELRGCSRYFYINLCKTVSHKNRRGTGVVGTYDSLHLSLTLSGGQPALVLIITFFDLSIFFSTLHTVLSSFPTYPELILFVSAFINVPFSPPSIYTRQEYVIYSSSTTYWESV